MDKLFLQIMNMSITSSFIILVIIALRLFLKKAPKKFSRNLWLIAFIRLVLPFSFESDFTLIPINKETIPQDIIYSQTPEIQSGIEIIDSTINGILPAPNIGDSVNPLQIWTTIGSFLWIAGIALLLIYSIYSTLKLSKRLKSAELIEGNIYVTDRVKTPFVFGVLNPKIFLPNNLSDDEKPYILKHEQIHIKRKDHIVKFVAFIISSIHWFNPFVWIAYRLLGEDMELSCDEVVIRDMGNNIKKNYSASLLSLSSGNRIIGGSPIAFGENNIKDRIKNILNYKEPKLWVVLLCAMVIAVSNSCLMIDPVKETKTVNNENNVNYNRISDYLEEEFTEVFSPHYEILGFEISDYTEEIVDGNVEAVFLYKMMSKNYDRDPDTVEYIKQAKDQGDKNYQTYYDEYLKPQESNFHFKVVINENGEIKLYTRDLAVEKENWEEVKVSDYVTK